jgi:hypothetical protein
VPESAFEGDFEIIGDQIRPLENVPLLPNLEGDSEDLVSLLMLLPILNIDSDNVDLHYQVHVVPCTSEGIRIMLDIQIVCRPQYSNITN